MRKLVIALLIVSCSASQKAAEHAALVCAESAASKDIVPAVESVLQNGLADWEAQLVALGVAYGSDVVNCAVAAAKADLATKTTAGSGMSSSPIQRADQYLHDHPAKTSSADFIGGTIPS